MSRITRILCVLLIFVALVIPALAVSAPGKLDPRNVTSTSFTATWIHPAADADFYRVEVWSNAVRLPVTETERLYASFTGLTPGTTYFVRVAAVYGSLIIYADDSIQVTLPYNGGIRRKLN